MKQSESRFVAVSRRAFLARSAALGAIVVVPGLACAKSDEEIFASATPVPAGTAAPTAVGETPTTPADEPTEQATATNEPTAAPEEPTAAPGGTFPAGGELLVAFSYVPASTGGRVLNPYIAVWVEDLNGNLVDTISVWFEQSSKGARYLRDLRRWYTTSDAAADTTMSGATRVAGSYTVAWDGTDLAGAPVAAGDYVLYLEAAREHGPYTLISSPLTLGSEPFALSVPADGELADVSAELVV
ncbi:MAG: DUF2271 domain-containing protein [Acidimicrobiales bacterium]|nr:DUF2271 domain-containing protein [Acidimicrobiales bacterium]